MTKRDANDALAFLMTATVRGDQAARFVEVCWALQSYVEPTAAADDETPEG